MIKYDKSIANGEKIVFSREKAIDYYTIQGVIKNIARIINNPENTINNIQNICLQNEKYQKADKKLLTEYINDGDFFAFFDYLEKK